MTAGGGGIGPIAGLGRKILGSGRLANRDLRRNLANLDSRGLLNSFTHVVAIGIFVMFLENSLRDSPATSICSDDTAWRDTANYGLMGERGPKSLAFRGVFLDLGC
jgi:hypothetical protein